MMYDPAVIAALRGQGGATSPGTQMPVRRSMVGMGVAQPETADTSGMNNTLGLLTQKGMGMFKSPAPGGTGGGASGLEGLISPMAPSSANPAGGMSAAGGGGGGGFGQAMASAGPWAALAAAIIGNEKYAKDRGYRSTDDKTYAKDLLTGGVLGQDVEKRFNPFMDKHSNGLWSKSGLGGDTQFGADLLGFNFKDAKKGFKNTSLVKALRKIF